MPSSISYGQTPWTTNKLYFRNLRVFGLTWCKSDCGVQTIQSGGTLVVVAAELSQPRLITENYLRVDNRADERIGSEDGRSFGIFVEHVASAGGSGELNGSAGNSGSAGGSANVLDRLGECLQPEVKRIYKCLFTNSWNKKNLNEQIISRSVARFQWPWLAVREW